MGLFGKKNKDVGDESQAKAPVNKKAKKNKRISNEAYAQFLSVIQRRVAEHGGVYKQLNLVSECINFMVEQRSRIDDLDKNSR